MMTLVNTDSQGDIIQSTESNAFIFTFTLKCKNIPVTSDFTTMTSDLATTRIFWISNVEWRFQQQQQQQQQQQILPSLSFENCSTRLSYNDGCQWHDNATVMSSL